MMKFILLFLSLSVLFLSNCGLEDVIALSPPLALTPDSGSDYFQLEVTSANNEPELRGFEIYYKFFSSTSIPTGYTSRSQLVSTGFRRLSSETEDDPGSIFPPLIDIPTAQKGRASTITVYFREISGDTPGGPPYLNDVYIDADDSGSGGINFTNFQVRRSVYEPGATEFKDFDGDLTDNQFDKDDDDLKTLSLTAGEEKVLYIALYAFSYGLDELEKVYSDAVYLGYIDIKIWVKSD